MGSLQDDSVPVLTPLERIGPKGYLRYVFPFQLPDNYDMEEAARVLRAGYSATKKQLPVLACEAVVDTEWKQAGVMKLKKMADGEIEDIVVKDLRGPGAFPMGYAELKEKGFPVAAFEADVVCRRSVWPTAGERLPISLVQANFIPGGLILTWCILHMVGDGKTFYTWTQVWARECQRAQRADLPPLDLPAALFDDRELLMQSSGRNAGRLEDHPEYTLLPFTPPGAPPKMMATNHRGQVFYLSKAALEALKAEASPANATQPSAQKWISTNDAVSALLWRTVMAVQFPLDRLEGDPVSVFNIAIDGRLRTNPPVHERTLGCFLEYVGIKLPIRRMLKALNLADIAVEIRKAIQKADKDFTDDVTALIEKLDHVDRLVPTAFLDVPGFNCVQSSWINFALYDLDWGNALGGRIEAVRSPDVGVLNGLQVVLPVLPDGGLEILMGVEESCLHRLMHDPLWTRYAEAR